MKDSCDWKRLFTNLVLLLFLLEGAFGEEPRVRAVTEPPGFHWFGYYDVNQYDPSQRYLLSMEVDFEGRSPTAEDEIRIGMIDLHKGNTWIPLGTSRAWGWQQGCRLQWRPGSDREVLWNDRAKGVFVCRILDTRTGKMRILPHPVYHVSPDGRWALGTDFSRINDMRPGYGYTGIPDPNQAVTAPEDSGIYKLDLETGDYTFLISLEQIVKIPYEGARPGDKHYFNHIEWNPDGTRFLFLHRWRPEGKRGFRTRMFTADAEGKAIRLVTDEPAISHYTWRDAEHIFMHREGYRLYKDDGSGKSELLLKASNGHQTFLPGGEWIVTDTYPSGKEREMELYLFHLSTRTKVTLGRFHVPTEYRGEYRVDLHPRVSPDGKTIVIDSAHEGKGRQLYLIEIKEILDGMKPPDCWLEAEDAEEAPGLETDLRKEGTSTGHRILGVHCDQEPEATAAWTFKLEKSITNMELRIRFAAEEGGAFHLLLDGEKLGMVSFPSTSGWGYADEEWQWGTVETGRTLEKGVHRLTLRAATTKPMNLDCLALYSLSRKGDVTLPLAPPDKVLKEKDVTLPRWSPAGLEKAGSFELGSKNAYQAWGVSGPERRFFFPEFLPALFERTLVLDEGMKGRRFDWIFTGKRGGFTVHAEPGAVYLEHRYYDSFAFNEMGEMGEMGERATRHPEWSARQEGVTYRGEWRSMTITRDHRLGFSVALNGRTVLERKDLFDLSRHQLRMTRGEGSLEGQWYVPASRGAAVRVRPETRHQVMIGFGGIATPTAFALLSPEGKKKWWEYVSEYNLLVQREYPVNRCLNLEMDNWDRMEDAVPHYYGDNFPNGEISDFDYIRALRKLNGQVWFEFWALPTWVGKDAEKYAEAMVAYCRISKERAGAPPDVVGIQNEVTQSEAFFHEMTLRLREKLDEAGFQGVKIHMSDHSNLAGGIDRAKIFRSSDVVWNTIDYSATHMYDYQNFFTRPDAYDALLEEWHGLTRDKPFLSTEICINNPNYQWDTYAVALTMGQLYHKNLVIAHASALCYCWTLLNVVQPSYGATRSLFVPDPSNGFMPSPSSFQLRVFGAYSRRVREGMVRVEAKVEVEEKDLLVSAFAGKGGLATLVAMNRSTNPLAMEVEWPEVRFEAVEVTDPYSENLVLKAPKPDTQGKTVVTVRPGAVVTLSNVPLGRYNP